MSPQNLRSLKPSDAANYLGIPFAELLTLHQSGKGPTYFVGGYSVWFRANDLDRFMKAARANATT